jgi:hypothetical protein
VPPNEDLGECSGLSRAPETLPRDAGASIAGSAGLQSAQIIKYLAPGKAFSIRGANMRRILLLLSVILLIGFSASLAQQNSKPAAEAAPAQLPAEASAKVNPVKPAFEGLADAKKLDGYHCSMCHGKDGDGKGDLAEQMKLTLHDWRDASSISKMTDGDLFYIITNGRGKMVGGEGDRRKETLRWELVNYVRLFGNKGTEAATSK